jgi:hypothetical protein
MERRLYGRELSEAEKDQRSADRRQIERRGGVSREVEIAAAREKVKHA